MVKLVTGEQLRADIDAGKTGDKVAFPDPAAAPLETDAEAGGDSTLFLSERRPTAPGRDRQSWGGLAFYIAAIGVIAILVIILALATS